jgi:hypothetical protein
MLLLQLLGQAAFVAASLVLGTKLVRLWQRTRELPELCVGLSFLLGGGLAYIAWSVLAVAAASGADPRKVAPLLLVGLLATCAGAVANGVAIARIYRPGARWTTPLLAALGLVMLGATVGTVVIPPPRSSAAFWTGLVATLPIWTWAAGESFALASTLNRRAKLGLADPLVVSRILFWGASAVIVVAMTSLAFVARLVAGPVQPPAVGVVNALLGMGSALVIWLGFFPPRAFRERLARAYAA